MERLDGSSDARRGSLGTVCLSSSFLLLAIDVNVSMIIEERQRREDRKEKSQITEELERRRKRRERGEN